MNTDYLYFNGKQMKALLSFCTDPKAQTKWQLNTPFVMNGKLFATDSRVCVRLSDFEYAPNFIQENQTFKISSDTLWDNNTNKLIKILVGDKFAIGDKSTVRLSDSQKFENIIPDNIVRLPDMDMICNTYDSYAAETDRLGTGYRCDNLKKFIALAEAFKASYFHMAFISKGETNPQALHISFKGQTLQGSVKIDGYVMGVRE